MPPNRFMCVEPGPNPPEVINVIVEIHKGRRSKFEVDKKTGLIRLDRYLYSSAHYPGDYGFIPQTLAADGDPLDVLVMVNEPTFGGCLIEARPLGLFKMTDNGTNDYKILAVPNTDPIFAEYHDLWRVPPHFLREVSHFFSTYKQLENNSNVEVQGWDDIDKAQKIIMKSIEAYKVSVEDSPENKKTNKKTNKKINTRKTKATKSSVTVVKVANRSTKKVAKKKITKATKSSVAVVKVANPSTKKVAKKKITKATTHKKIASKK